MTARLTTQVDPKSEALAESFARTYLTWGGPHDATVDLPDDIEPPDVPADQRQTVTWTTVADARRTAPGTTVITIAAQTSGGPYSLAVTIGRGPHGTRRILGPPALVGAVPVTPGRPRHEQEPEVTDQALLAVTRRALKNYLAADATDLVADLDQRAVVVTPDQPTRLRSIDATTWVTPRRRVGAVLRTRNRAGVELTLRYELAVVRRAGRWLVRAIHTNPNPEAQP